jgi:hypothetical protein
MRAVSQVRFPYASMRCAILCRHDADLLVPTIDERTTAWETKQSIIGKGKFLNPEEKDLFIGLLMQMLVTKPEERSLIAAILTNPFLQMKAATQS